MQPAPPPQYSSQAQFYAPPGAQGNYPAEAPPQLMQPQPYQQQENQGAQRYAWKFLCCFRGSKGSYLRLTSIVLGAIITIYGLISIVIAAVAMTENPRAEVEDPNDPGTVKVVYKAPTLTAYGLYISLLKGVAVGENKIVGGILGAIFPTIIDEILPGACLIAGAMLLKDILCLVSIVPLIIWFALNAIDIILAPLTFVAAFTVPRDNCNDADCGTMEAITIVFTILLIRFICCCYALFCIIVAVAVRHQIRNGVYDMRGQPVLMPPPMTYSVTGGQTAIAEQTDSAAEQMRPTEEPVAENT